MMSFEDSKSDEKDVGLIMIYILYVTFLGRNNGLKVMLSNFMDQKFHPNCNLERLFSLFSILFLSVKKKYLKKVKLNERK